MATRRTKLYAAGVMQAVADRPYTGGGYLAKSDGVGEEYAGVTYRFKEVPGSNLIGVRLVYRNWYCTVAATGDIATPNTITVKASIETGVYPFAVGTFYPVTFEGASTVGIPAGGQAVSDVVYVPLAAGVPFYTRTYVSCAVNGGWPVGIGVTPADGEGMTLNGDTTAGSAVGTAHTFGYGPSAIIGVSDGSGIATGCCYFGDSIAAGNNDYLDPGNCHGGFINRALTALGIGQIALARSGTLSVDLTTGASALRMKEASFAQQAIIAYGANDALYGSVSVATYKAQMIAGVARLKAHGVRDVYACTVPPITTSTDSWATLANQTLSAGETLRQGYNAWLRDTSATGFVAQAGAAGVFDTGAACEDLATGKWKVDGTAYKYTSGGAYPQGGLHPSPFAHQAMAAVIEAGAAAVGLGLFATLGPVEVRGTVVVGSGGGGGYSSGLASIVTGASLTWHKGDTGPGAFITTQDSAGNNIDVSAYYSSVEIVYQRQGQVDVIHTAAFTTGIPAGETVAQYGVTTDCPPTDIVGNLNVLVRFITATGIIETAPNPLNWTVKP